MKKTMKKSTKGFLNNLITYAIVIIAFVFTQMALSKMIPGVTISRSLKGQLIPICVYIVMAVSLNLTVGISGELSLGHAGFMSVGAFSGIIMSGWLLNAFQMENETMRLVLAFQSTLPAWGATRFRQRGQGRRSDFNPRSPHGERRQQLHAGHPQRAISIHAPRMGSDNRESAGDAHSLYFNPRSPHGERPVRNVCDCF